MDIPTHLKHKPIIGVKDYDDGDAQALSIGFAQWENETDDISAKIFRYNDRWSPQSEEMPLHRVIDLSILIIASFLDQQTSSITDLGEIVVDKEHLNKIKEYYQDNEENLKKRIKELNRIIDLFLNKTLISPINPSVP